jgi:endonuclease/exonuclease/phosphatase family metal-dependent hydrolase
MPLVLCFALTATASCRPPGASTAVPRADAAGGNAIVLDGHFTDWQTAGAVLATRFETVDGSAVRLDTLWAADDAAWMYLSFAVRDTITAQAMPGTLHVLLDTDDDATTGGTVLGAAGIDAVVDLSPTTPGPRGTRGAGSSLRVPNGDASSHGLGARRNALEVGAVMMPTWSAPRFELRLARSGAPDGFARLGQTMRIQLVFEDQGTVLSRSDILRHTLRTSPGPDPFTRASPGIPSRAAGSVRVVQWNVAGERFRTPARHARLLGAVQPDVVLLDEVYENVSDSSLAAFFAEPTLAALGAWRWVRSGSGGRQKTVVATRDRAIRPAETMTRVEFAPGALDSLRAIVPADFRRTLEVEERDQIPATGAWVEVGGLEVLFVPLDLRSAGYHGSPNDAVRLLQVRTIRGAIARELQGRRAPLVIAGDFNPVGAFAPVAELMRGLDIDGGDLRLAGPARLGEATWVTWRNPDVDLFGPGRLDLTLYSTAALERTGGFVFASEDLTPVMAAALGLERGDSQIASDHLIVVTDVRPRR